MLLYLDKNKQYIFSIACDEGKEFMGEFTERLDEEKISIRRLNPEK